MKVGMFTEEEMHADQAEFCLQASFTLEFRARSVT